MNQGLKRWKDLFWNAWGKHNENLSDFFSFAIRKKFYLFIWNFIRELKFTECKLKNKILCKKLLNPRSFTLIHIPMSLWRSLTNPKNRQENYEGDLRRDLAYQPTNTQEKIMIICYFKPMSFEGLG